MEARHCWSPLTPKIDNSFITFYVHQQQFSLGISTSQNKTQFNLYSILTWEQNNANSKISQMIPISPDWQHFTCTLHVRNCANDHHSFREADTTPVVTARWSFAPTTDCTQKQTSFVYNKWSHKWCDLCITSIAPISYHLLTSTNYHHSSPSARGIANVKTILNF